LGTLQAKCLHLDNFGAENEPDAVVLVIRRRPLRFKVDFMKTATLTLSASQSASDQGVEANSTHLK
jgi:hypothetical protein